jgi:transcriptional regulator with XRE-family HTH domain
VSDVPASLTTGEIIRHLRERRGLTRPVLAGLVGYSADWLKRIEAGQRGISIPALIRIARVLHVDDLSTLIDGDRPLPVSAWEGPDHPVATAVRQIAGINTFAPADRETEPDVVALAAGVDQAWRDWHTLPDNHTTVARALPELITALEQATVVLDAGQRRLAHASLAGAYGLAQHLAVDMVEPELGRVIADRAARAAHAADDPVSLAFGAWTYGHVLRSVDADTALRIVAEAAAELERHMAGDPDAMCLFGSLNLHMAISAAYQGQSGSAWGFWDVANATVRRLPSGYYHPQTVFGAENVAIHGVSIAAELRRAGEAIGRAERIDPQAVPSRERRGRLFGEIAAGHMQRREYDAALHFLRMSYMTSPEEVPFAPLTRGVAVELVRNATGSLKAEAVSLASEIGILPSV